jgi:hypothetical protein
MGYAARTFGRLPHFGIVLPSLADRCAKGFQMRTRLRCFDGPREGGHCRQCGMWKRRSAGAASFELAFSLQDRPLCRNTDRV